MSAKNSNRYDAQINALLAEYQDRACAVTVETAKNLLVKHFPEVSPKGYFHCVVSFNSFLNAHNMNSDFPEAYTVYLNDYTPEQINEIKNRYINDKEAAKEVFVADVEKYAA
ncbi:MAG: hypothetical protein LBR70_03720 [Lactobacillaceae bacterium]|jgi:hypothetical protein|nr:hypothetical protein [Lactobacillaceae bacterium]